MHAFANTVRGRLVDAARAAGVTSNLPEQPADIAVSVAIREARRCDLALSIVFDDRFGLHGES